jgi:hypothetical protein
MDVVPGLVIMSRRLPRRCLAGRQRYPVLDQQIVTFAGRNHVGYLCVLPLVLQ